MKEIAMINAIEPNDSSKEMQPAYACEDHFGPGEHGIHFFTQPHVFHKIKNVKFEKVTKNQILPEWLTKQQNEWELETHLRTDGFECLAFHKGKWAHVKWCASHEGWSLGRGKPFIEDGNRAFAHLPDNTPSREFPNGFFDWKG